MEDRPTRRGRFPGLSEEQVRLEKRQYKQKKSEKRKKDEVDSGEDTEDTTDVEVGEEEKKKSLKSKLTRRFKCSISLGKRKAEERRVDEAREETSEESLSVTDSTAEMAPTEIFYRPIEYDDLVGTEVA